MPERNWAKVVTAFADGEPIQAVVPANCDVDFERLAKVVGVPHIRMATEDELDWLYPDCEPGAMPPLGPLYHQLVFVDERLTADEEVVFNAGSFRDAVAMRFIDFVRPDAAGDRPVRAPKGGSFVRAAPVPLDDRDEPVARGRRERSPRSSRRSCCPKETRVPAARPSRI